MNKKTVMAMPIACFWAIIGICLLGIITGSFFDASLDGIKPPINVNNTLNTIKIRAP